MAGKKKNAGQPSKTARASTRAGQSGAADAVATALHSDINRIVPLDGGRFAYVLHPVTGKTLHLRTDSDAFDDTVAELAGLGLGARLRRELAGLADAFPTAGWAAVLERLDAAGRLDTPNA